MSRCLLGAGTESAGRALPPPSSSGPRLSRPRRLVDPKALRIRVLGGRDSWSTRGTLAPGPIWPGTRVEPTSAHTRDASVGRAGRPQGSSDREPRRPGALSDPASAGTRDQMIPGRWSTLCKPGPGTESGRRAGRPHSCSDPGPSGPEEPADPAAILTRGRVGRQSWCRHSSSDLGPRWPGQRKETAGQDCWPTLCQLGPGNESAWRARRPNSSLNLGPCRPGQLGDPAAAQTRDASARGAGRPYSSSDAGPSRPGQLVEAESVRARSSVARDSRLTLRQLRPGTESVGVAGAVHSSAEPGPSLPGQLVDPRPLGPGTDLAGTTGRSHVS